MKKLIFISIAILSLSFLLSSCNKDEFTSITKKYKITFELITENQTDSTILRYPGGQVSGVGNLSANIEEGKSFWYTVNSYSSGEYTLKIYKENNEKKSISNIVGWQAMTGYIKNL